MTGPPPDTPPILGAWVSAAAGAMEHYCDNLGVETPSPALARGLARAALEATAPLIAAEATARLATLRTAVQQVLDDEESGDGGWGPDVTMVTVLQDAMRDTEP